MDIIISWAKENYDLFSLFVGLIGVVLAVISLYFEIRRKKIDLAIKIEENRLNLT